MLSRSWGTFAVASALLILQLAAGIKHDGIAGGALKVSSNVFEDRRVVRQERKHRGTASIAVDAQGTLRELSVEGAEAFGDTVSEAGQTESFDATQESSLLAQLGLRTTNALGDHFKQAARPAHAAASASSSLDSQILRNLELDAQFSSPEPLDVSINATFKAFISEARKHMMLNEPEVVRYANHFFEYMMYLVKATNFTSMDEHTQLRLWKKLAKAAAEAAQPVQTQGLVDNLNSQSLSWVAAVSPELHSVSWLQAVLLAGVIEYPHVVEEAVQGKPHPRGTDFATKSDSDEASSYLDQAPGCNEDFDARAQWSQCADVMSHIRDQGQCGSSWAVAVAAVADARLCIATGARFSGMSAKVSAGYVAACEGGVRGNGCEGGSPLAAFRFLGLHGAPTGGDTEDEVTCVPYFASGSALEHLSGSSATPPCPSECYNRQYPRMLQEDIFKGRDFRDVDVTWDVQRAKAAMTLYGPIAVAMYVYRDFYSYRSGIYATSATSDLAGAHAMVAIGYGRGYILLKNSWGRLWGDGGFVKVSTRVPMLFYIPRELSNEAELQPLPMPNGPRHAVRFNTTTAGAPTSTTTTLAPTTAPGTTRVTAESGSAFGECRWVQTQGCGADVLAVPGETKDCNTSIAHGAAGYCDCDGNGVKDAEDPVYECGQTPGRCADACHIQTQASSSEPPESSVGTSRSQSTTTLSSPSTTSSAHSVITEMSTEQVAASAAGVSSTTPSTAPADMVTSPAPQSAQSTMTTPATAQDTTLMSAELTTTTTTTTTTIATTTWTTSTTATTIFPAMTPPSAAPGVVNVTFGDQYEIVVNASGNCPVERQIRKEVMCKVAAKHLHLEWGGVIDNATAPAYCFVDKATLVAKVLYNLAVAEVDGGNPSPNTSSICIAGGKSLEAYMPLGLGFCQDLTGSHAAREASVPATPIERCEAACDAELSCRGFDNQSSVCNLYTVHQVEKATGSVMNGSSFTCWRKEAVHCGWFGSNNGAEVRRGRKRFMANSPCECELGCMGLRKSTAWVFDRKALECRCLRTVGQWTSSQTHFSGRIVQQPRGPRRRRKDKSAEPNMTSTTEKPTDDDENYNGTSTAAGEDQEASNVSSGTTTTATGELWRYKVAAGSGLCLPDEDIRTEAECQEAAKGFGTYGGPLADSGAADSSSTRPGCLADEEGFVWFNDVVPNYTTSFFDGYTSICRDNGNYNSSSADTTSTVGDKEVEFVAPPDGRLCEHGLEIKSADMCEVAAQNFSASFGGAVDRTDERRGCYIGGDGDVVFNNATMTLTANTSSALRQSICLKAISQRYTVLGTGECVDAHGNVTPSEFVSADPEQCQAQCSARPSCTGFENRSSGCHLVFDVSVASARHDLGSGFCHKRLAQDCGRHGHQQGAQLGSMLQTPDACSCQLRCVESGECVGYTYFHRFLQCQLLSALAAVSHDCAGFCSYGTLPERKQTDAAAEVGGEVEIDASQVSPMLVQLDELAGLENLSSHNGKAPHDEFDLFSASTGYGKILSENPNEGFYSGYYGATGTHTTTISSSLGTTSAEASSGTAASVSTTSAATQASMATETTHSVASGSTSSAEAEAAPLSSPTARTSSTTTTTSSSVTTAMTTSSTSPATTQSTTKAASTTTRTRSEGTDMTSPTSTTRMASRYTFQVLSGLCVQSKDCVSSPGWPDVYGPNQSCEIQVAKLEPKRPDSTSHAALLQEPAFEDAIAPPDRVGFGGDLLYMNKFRPHVGGVLSTVRDRWRVLGHDAPSESWLWRTSAAEEKVELEVHSFATERGYDTLIVNGAPYSGANGPHGVTVSGTMHWSSDSSVVGRGFRICVNQHPGMVPIHTEPSGWTTPRSITDDMYQARVWAVVPGVHGWPDCRVDSDYCITSPMFPNPYPAYSSCKIMIAQGASVELNVMNFSTEAFFDSLLVNRQRYSGQDSPHGVKATGIITWSSDASIADSGWKICPKWQRLHPFDTSAPSHSESSHGGGQRRNGTGVGGEAHDVDSDVSGHINGYSSDEHEDVNHSDMGDGSHSGSSAATLQQSRTLRVMALLLSLTATMQLGADGTIFDVRWKEAGQY
mmetsp:Transcript_30549/g.71332  ORF Transcript_30549/g.71332 Transcript_30549/m.71332 type:complete len:2065 (-) Transcript_30549:45-6239(-)